MSALHWLRTNWISCFFLGSAVLNKRVFNTLSTAYFLEASSLELVLLFTSLWVRGMLRGQRINSVAYPWVAGLVEERTWLAKCSGAIVHSHFVLTASSCFLKPGTSDEIEKSRYVVVAPSRVNQVRKIDLLAFPNDSIFDFQTPGLIGVEKAFNLRPGRASKLSLWSWDMTELTKQFDYLFDHAGYLSCAVVTWKDETPVTLPPLRNREVTTTINGLKTTRDRTEEEVPKSENAYNVQVVSVAEVQLVQPDVCVAKLCSKFTHKVDCEILLNKSMCVKAQDPQDAYLCGTDQGAAISCQGFTWGLLVGEVNCKSAPQNQSVPQYPLFFRVDYAVDLIKQYSQLYPPDGPDLSIVILPEPMILLSAQYTILLLRFYRYILF